MLHAFGSVGIVPAASIMSNFQRSGDFKVTASKGGGRSASFYEHDDRSGGPPQSGHWRGRGGGRGGGGRGSDRGPNRNGDRNDNRNDDRYVYGNRNDRYDNRNDRYDNRNDRYDNRNDRYDNRSDNKGGSYRGGGRGGGGSSGGGGKWQSGGGRRDRTGRGGRRNRQGRGGGGERGRGRGRGGPTPRARLMDDDIDMDDDGTNKTNSNRYTPYGGRRKPQKRESGGSSSGSVERLGLPVKGNDRNTWCKIIIPHGKKSEREWLIKSIQNLCTEPFIPREFKYEQQSAVFYVDDVATGYAIRDVSHRITTPSGHKIIIQARPCQPQAKSVLDDKDIQLLKECMSKRYDPSSKLLDLSNLSNDADLDGRWTAVVSNHFNAILNIIVENIPQMTTLHLDANRLFSLKNMQDLVFKLPNITSLSLAQNQLKSDLELDNLKGLKLEKLTLDGNPLCDNFKDQSCYISAVRSRFPKVVMLDGHELPPPITFDLETNTALPPIQPNFFASDQIKAILLPFLEKYFKTYDSDDRQSLLEVYHDQACFSLSVPMSHKGGMGQYLKESRNLLVAKDPEYRKKLIKQKKVPIVAYLHELPASQHDLASFKVDVSMARGSLLCFTVNGVYKEVKSNNSMVGAFSRVFFAAHNASTGLCIINDELCLKPATNQQLKSAFSSPGPTLSTSSVAVPPGNLSPAHGLLQGITPAQQEMVAQFVRVSGMNADWSIKCLIENNWNFEEAGTVFTALQREGKIPPEAFKKD